MVPDLHYLIYVVVDEDRPDVQRRRLIDVAGTKSCRTSTSSLNRVVIGAPCLRR